MKILLVICLLAAAYAAPAERITREILPGDPRYDSHSHHHNDDHKHHQNEIETSKALQNSFAGSAAVPDLSYGIFGSTTGSPLDFSDYFKYDFGARIPNFNPDVSNIGSAKSSSVTESSVNSPKSVSGNLELQTDTAASVEQVSQKNDEEAGKSIEVPQGESPSTPSPFGSSGISRTSVKTAAGESKSSGKSVTSSEAGFSSDTLLNPFRSTFDLTSSFDSGFGSSLGQQSFGSGFGSFDQSSFTPTFRSGLNANYDFGNVNYPLGFSTYSGFDQLPQSQIIDSEYSASFPQFNPVEYNRNLGYISPYSFNYQSGYSAPTVVTASPFSSLLSVTQAPPTDLKQIFKNYNPVPSTKSTSVSIEKSIEPNAKISQRSSSSISQVTDTNGGYVY